MTNCTKTMHAMLGPSNVSFSLWAARELDSVYALCCWQLREPSVVSNRRVWIPCLYNLIFFSKRTIVTTALKIILNGWNLNFEFVKKVSSWYHQCTKSSIFVMADQINFILLFSKLCYGSGLDADACLSLCNIPGTLNPRRNTP